MTQAYLAKTCDIYDWDAGNIEAQEIPADLAMGSVRT